MSKQEDFLTNITEVYKDYQKNNIPFINTINRLQRNFGYKEVYDMNIRANNALARSIKYFKKHNINYYDDIDINHDRFLMLSCQSYVLKKFVDSQNILNSLVCESNDISDKIINSFEFKLKYKYAKQIPILYKKPMNFKDKYKDTQSKVEEFLSIGNEIDEFNPETDLIKTYDIYVPVLFNNMGKVGKMLYKDINEAKKAQYVLFHDELMHVISTLFKLGKYDDVQKLCKLEQDIIQDDAIKFGCDVKKLKKER